MPELPEVQTVVNTLRDFVLGRTIGNVHLARTDIVRPVGLDLPALLINRTIVDIARRGKRIVFSLDSGACFYIHLGMSGRLTVDGPGDPLLKHTHLTIHLDNNQQLRFRDPRRFGGVWWLGDDADSVADGAMGPEPFGLRTSQLARQLARTRRAIKTALLDQRLIAGLGNIYVDEALFAAKVHPLQPGCELTAPQIATLNRAIKATLRRAIHHKGSTLRDYVDAAGNKGAFQKLHRVYAREGKPCVKCGNKISRIVLGGRSTHFCPTCQPDS